MHLFRLLRAIYYNRSYSKALTKAYKEDEIISKLSHMFGVQFRQDWIGRLYAVINPAIKDGKFDYDQAFEYTSYGYDTTEHAQQWMMQRVALMNGFVQANNLFDLLTFRIEKLDNNGNYLFIILPITLPDVLDNIKGSIIETALLASAAVVGFIFWPW